MKEESIKIVIIISLITLFFLIKKKETLTLTKNIITCDESTYFTTWATGIYSTRHPPINLNYNSLRQIFQISAGGDNMRIKISNEKGKTNLEIKNVCIADSISKSEINKTTIKYITFNGKYNSIIGAGEEIYSDTIIYPLKPLSKIAISIYFGSVPKQLSGHEYSFTYSYIEKGNTINKKKFSDRNKIAHSYFISLMEISSDNPKKVIVCFGDSITDGVIFNNEIRDSYPGILFEEIYKNNKSTEFAVVNEGINADKLTSKGIIRYKHDVLDIKGISHIIVLYGVNDLNVLNATSEEIISGYKKIIQEAHQNKILIYAGTILPFSNYIKAKCLWNEQKEKVREETNNWIRNTKPEKGGFDHFFDFDNAIKDPKNKTIMKDIYDSGDGIHPGTEGYKKMVDVIKESNLFTINQIKSKRKNYI